MKNFFTLTLCFLTLSITAQEPLTYPYNPDSNSDTFVAIPDLLETLTVYGSQFFPEEIMVGDTTLSSWIQILNQTLANQQAVIDSLQASLDSQETQLDSTMIADMIAAAGGLGGGGGCDVRFPDGLDGEYFTTLLRDNEMNDYPYTVPEGKTLYITSAYAGDEILITNNNGGESKIITGSNGGGNSERSLHNPIILYEGQTVSGYGNPNNPTSINAFLIDSGVEPITVNGGSFQVPLGKKLYVTNIRGDFYLDNDDELIKLASNSGYTHFIGHPIVFNSNQTAYVSGANTNDGGTFNGYLVDEDYFADCGGGGSSDGVSVFMAGLISGSDTVFVPESADVVYLEISGGNGHLALPLDNSYKKIEIIQEGTTGGNLDILGNSSGNYLSTASNDWQGIAIAIRNSEGFWRVIEN